jgi:gluconate 2-dehydrogenase gamma chain
MSRDRVSRRHVLKGGSALASTALLRLGMPSLFAAAQAACSARDEGASFQTLNAAEALEFEAIAARIIPTTDTPGAREAGVIHFFDRLLGAQLADMLPPLRGGLADLQTALGAAAPFSSLSEAEQDARLAEHDRTPFFEMIRTLTLFGFFAMSRYGGNRDNLGWKLIGFQGHGATQPPFGYYDARYRGLDEREASALGSDIHHSSSEAGHHGV